MNEEHRQALLRLGVDAPERWDEHSTEEGTEGVIRWAHHSNRQGKPPTAGQVCMKLKNGGLAGFGEEVADSRHWSRNSKLRYSWLELHLPNLDPIYTEAAILELARAKQEPSVESVKGLAMRLEREQMEYEESLRAQEGTE
jgi:hypothetical protein